MKNIETVKIIPIKRFKKDSLRKDAEKIKQLDNSEASQRVMIDKIIDLYGKNKLKQERI